MRRESALLLASMLVASPGFSSSLSVGTVSLSLGAEKTSVLQELRANYHLVEVKGKPETFFVSTAKPPKGDVVGGVEFASGRLVWVQRSWGSFSGRTASAEASKALFAAVESATAASGSSAVITTQTQRVPGMEFKTIYFSFPSRKVILSITDVSAPQNDQLVGIEESIRGEK